MAVTAAAPRVRKAALDRGESDRLHAASDGLDHMLIRDPAA